MATIDSGDWAWLGLVGISLFHLVGFLHVVHAVMHVRTSQGTIAWVVSLITFPYLSIPLYWLLGRTRFHGYVRARQHDDEQLKGLVNEMHRIVSEHEVDIAKDDAIARMAQHLSGIPFTNGNELTLLINGDETFQAIFEEIEKATKYVCINFYIVKNDQIGVRLQQLLIKKAKEGIKIRFLFDEVGSHKLSRKYLRELREAGVEYESFGINRTWVSRFQYNFRNHRKMVIVDGEVGFIGGINVGDEYLGRDQKFGDWRDTHLMMRGPVVEALQLVFLEDWYWAAEKLVHLTWQKEDLNSNQVAAIIPTGPADRADSWQLLVVEAANTARDKLWIASPYFVPDEGVLAALQTAALRGVDVRILIPERADHLLVWLAAFTYFEQTIPYGVKICKYTKGFLHQKVLLLDDRLAAVGSANLDNRSFRLNFEIMAFSPDQKFVHEVTAMLNEDFTHSYPVTIQNFAERPFYFRLGARIARLFSPIL